MARGERTVRGPVEQFQFELEDFVNNWITKPPDDRLNYPEIVGCLELMKLELAKQCLEESEDEDGEDF